MEGASAGANKPILERAGAESRVKKGTAPKHCLWGKNCKKKYLKVNLWLICMRMINHEIQHLTDQRKEKRSDVSIWKVFRKPFLKIFCKINDA
jgi:hypothetical protein